MRGGVVRIFARPPFVVALSAMMGRQSLAAYDLENHESQITNHEPRKTHP